MGSLSLNFLKTKNAELYHYAEVGKISCSYFHDVLNPITGLLLYLETLEISGSSSCTNPAREAAENIREFIKIIQRSFEKGEIEKPCFVNEIIKNTIKIIRHKAIRNNVALIFVEKNKVSFETKESKIYQIFINLISNAIDAFDNVSDGRKKAVTIILEEVDDFIVANVKDNGMGMKQNILQNIFQTFFTTKSYGNGLGLKMVKKIVEEELRGKISVKSKYGEGTDFSLVFKK